MPARTHATTARRVRTVSAVDAVTEALRDELPADPGNVGPLTEVAVAGRYDVAQPTAKAAIERLVCEGLLLRSASKTAQVPRLGLAGGWAEPDGADVAAASRWRPSTGSPRWGPCRTRRPKPMHGSGRWDPSPPPGSSPPTSRSTPRSSPPRATPGLSGVAGAVAAVRRHLMRTESVLAQHLASSAHPCATSHSSDDLPATDGSPS